MTAKLQQTHLTEVQLIEQFFQQTSGAWRSQRHYYTLPKGDTQDILSLITIRFLPQGCEELIHLAQLHELADTTAITCGSFVTWYSTDTHSGKQVSEGTTIFGVLGNHLYRDRGYATKQPVAATFRMADPHTLQLRTEYNRSLFEEEIKLVGDRYRTRQTIVTKAGEQQLIGQYLETRI